MNKSILAQNFLDDDFEIFDPRGRAAATTFGEIDERTYFETVNPAEIKLFSLIKKIGDKGYMQCMKLNPDHIDIKMLMPQNMKQVYFNKENRTVGSVEIAPFKEAGMSDKQIKGIEAAGFFLEYPFATGKLILIPSKGFLAPFCRWLEIGKLKPGIDPFRDLYLASRLKYAEPFNIVYRKAPGGMYGKAFTCMSDRTCPVKQKVLFDFLEVFEKYEVTSIKRWKYTHEKTYVDFLFNKVDHQLVKKAKIDIGVRLTFSDVGESAFVLRTVLYTYGGTVLLPRKIIKKRSAKLDINGMVSDFMRIELPFYQKKLKELNKYNDVHVPQLKDAVSNILDALDYDHTGLNHAESTRQNYVENISGSGTGLDAIMYVLRIPGIIRTMYCDTAIERVSECIGKIFDVKLDSVINHGHH